MNAVPVNVSFNILRCSLEKDVSGNCVMGLCVFFGQWFVK